MTELEKQYAKGRKDALLEAAKEVRSHWNNSQTMTNQKHQATRSADFLLELANSIKLT